LNEGEISKKIMRKKEEGKLREKIKWKLNFF